MQGFIYILRNASMPGILKIGKTTRHPEKRAKELFTSGVPTPFEIVTAFWSKNIGADEWYIHDELSETRVSGSREFFKIREASAISVVGNVCLSDSGYSLAREGVILDGGDVARYADLCGIGWYEIVTTIDFISPCAWKAAAAALENKKASRLNKAKEVSDAQE